MIPVEKSSMQNTIARGAMGQRTSEGNIAMLNFLDEKSLDKSGKRGSTPLERLCYICISQRRYWPSL